MEVVTSPAVIQTLAQEYRAQGLSIALVPTMGWFHDGHLALMRRARSLADRVIVTLFVNPIQFGPNEDLGSYPHDLERDRTLAEATGVDLIFAPEKGSMYPKGFASTVSIKGLTSSLCGASRPGHFDGVTTVVSKLFNLTLPHFAVFGEKDFQQLAVIRRMQQDLDFPVSIVGHPIVREKNGLAMSSRNSNLRKDEQEAALSLSRSIHAAKKLFAENGSSEVSVEEVKNIVLKTIVKHKECNVDYIEIVDRESLKPCTLVNCDSILVLAVKINDRVRLIDNSILIES